MTTMVSGWCSSGSCPFPKLSSYSSSWEAGAIPGFHMAHASQPFINMKQHTASVLLAFALAIGILNAAEQPKAIFPKDSFDFGKVVRGAIVEHEFVLRNDGTAPLQLGKVRMSPPLIVTRMPARVDPGSQASLRFKLDTSNLIGQFDGFVLVAFSDPSIPEARLSVEGAVVATIEANPRAFFVVVDRDMTQEQSLEIRNHEPEPVRITKVDFPSDRAAIKLETVEEGRRYRLTLTAKGQGVAGKKTEIIQVTTSSPSMPVLKIAANTYVRERVYTFPESVDLGALPVSVIKKTPDLLKQSAQTLMVYRKGTTDFQVTASTDLPLSLKSERGPLGDRWQFTITLKDESMKAGPITGAIIIRTNDSEFPQLTVPVSGNILDR